MDSGCGGASEVPRSTKLAVYMCIYSIKKMENQCGDSSNSLDCGVQRGGNKTVDCK